MNVALRAVHDGLGTRDAPSDRWTSFASHLRARCGNAPVDTTMVASCLDTAGISVPAAEWRRHLCTLGVLDAAGRYDARRADDVAIALGLIGDSFEIAPPRSAWAPVATVPEAIRAVMRPPPLRQTAGTLLGLVDRASNRILLAAPYVDATAVRHLHGSLAAAMRRGVRVHVLTSVGHGAELNPLVDDAVGSPRCRLTVTELHTDTSSLGSHAKVLVVDGSEGYVGSANLTAAGFGRHVEVGVEVSGPQVEDLVRLLDALERLGTRVVTVAGGVVRRCPTRDATSMASTVSPTRRASRGGIALPT